MTDKVKEGLGRIKQERLINHFRRPGMTFMRWEYFRAEPSRIAWRRLFNTTAIKEPDND
jgi:hypothetical protein